MHRILTKDELIDEGLMTVKEACHFLKVSNSGLYNLMTSGQLPFTKIGGSRRVPIAAVKRLAFLGLSV